MFDRGLLTRFFRKVLTASPIGSIPVRVRAGLAKGLKWTLFPYSMYWRHGYIEKEVLAALSFIDITQPAVCWDLGAHFGICTVSMARIVGAEGTVISFEPDPYSYRKCHRHVTMNHLQNVRLFNAAVSETNGMQKLIVGNGLGHSTSHFRYSVETEPTSSTRDVETVALDSLVRQGLIPLPHLIKIDVEGHGAGGLLGAKEAIGKSKPVIVMSFHSIDEYEDSRDLLEPMGYLPMNERYEALDWKDILYRTAILETDRSRSIR